MYVNELIGPMTVNTMPLMTLEACADHCNVASNRLESGVAEAEHLLASLKDPDININLDEIMTELLRKHETTRDVEASETLSSAVRQGGVVHLLAEGIDKFVQPYQSLMQSLEEKVEQLSAV